jgi:glutaminase
MNNKFINNNGVNLLHTKNKKTLVESRIEMLKNQEQKIITELERWETKQKKADRLLNYLDEVNRFSTKHLAEAVEKEKNQEQPDNWAWEYLLKNKVEFALKFEPASKTFYELIFQKTESQVSYLKSQLRDIQSQLSHQERLFARMEIRRQGRVLLECKSGYRLGCPGVYQCDNCKANYSVVDNQAIEITK